MSFYNMMFGKNPVSDLVLAIVGLKENDIERFRDCGIDLEEKEVWVYTRTGGNNRDDYENLALVNSPYYKYDSDDEYDNTYATYTLSIPEEIYDDLVDFLDYTNKGISAKFIQWIDKTLSRPETESDNRTKQHSAQMQRLEQLQKTGEVSVAFNGHTVIPLSDRGMRSMLEVIEQNEGEFIAYWYFLPFKFEVLQNEARWESDKKKPSIEQDQVRTGISIVWEIDMEAWKRYEKKYGEKYPKSIAKMKEQIENKERSK
jgi:hypothetical protein